MFFSMTAKINDSVTPYVFLGGGRKKATLLPLTFFSMRAEKNDSVTPYAHNKVISKVGRIIDDNQYVNVLVLVVQWSALLGKHLETGVQVLVISASLGL